MEIGTAIITKKLFFAPARLEMLTGFTLPPAGGIRTQGFS